MQQQQQLLESSQTFLGVLATVFVLCVLLNESNFIHKILVSIKDGILNSIKDISVQSRRSFNHYIDELKNSVEFYNYLTKEPSGVNVKLQQEGIRILDDLSLSRQDIENKSNEIQDKYTGVFECIAKKNEVSTSSLYAFFYCIVIFIADELFVSNLLPISILLVFICSFTVLSILLCFFIWGNYWISTQLKECRLTKEERPAEKTLMSKRIMTFLKCIGLYMLFLAIALVICQYSYCSSYDSLMIWSVACMASAVFPVGLYYCIKFDKRYLNFRPTYIFSHFLYLLLLSIVFVSILYWLKIIPSATCETLSDFSKMDSNLQFIRSLIFTFALLNGLLLPFCIPFLRYRTCWRKADRESQKLNEESNNKLNGMITAFNQFKESVRNSKMNGNNKAGATTITQVRNNSTKTTPKRASRRNRKKKRR